MSRLSLKIYLPLIIGSLLFVAQGLFALWDGKIQKQKLFDVAHAELINTGYRLMDYLPRLLVNDSQNLSLQELQQITRSEDIHEVTLIDHEGMIRQSTHDGLQGQDVISIQLISRSGYEMAMYQRQFMADHRKSLLQSDLYLPASITPPITASVAMADPLSEKLDGLLLLRGDFNHRWESMKQQLIAQAAEKMAVTFAVMLFMTILLRRLVTTPLQRLARCVEVIDDPEQKPASSSMGCREIGDLEELICCKAGSVRELSQALERSDQRWQFALNSTCDGVCDWDLQTNRVEYSSQWARMLGFKPEEIGDTVGEWESRVHPDDLNSALTHRRNILNGKAEEADNVHRLKTKSGGYIWVLVRRMVVERSESGQPSRMISTQTNITENRAAQEMIKYQAHYDDVTRLSNRRHLLEKLELEIERSKVNQYFGALIYLDIDHFKHVNDMMGHAAGDLLLRLIAHRLSDGRQIQETVARLGGDEFALLLPDLSSNRQKAESKALKAVDDLRSRMSKHFTIKGSDLELVFTTGVAIFPNVDSNSTEILRQADIALYQGKDAGRGGVYFFVEAMAEKVQERHRLQQMMRNAINDERMTLYYQPRYNSDYEMVGAETLLRWFDKDSGWISPGRFIPLAEESGLIVPLGSWIMRGACRALKQWEDRGCPETFKTLSVNVSPKQFHRSKFVQETLDIIREEGCSPELLELEITEGMLVDNVEATIEKIKQLRAIGVRFSVDDFGTGYSSLAYLNKLPINCLKIDKSFIDEVQNGGSECAIISTIIAMANNLDLEVIAEGVETEYQLAFLKYRGCFVYQGFYFSEALEPELLEERLFVKQHLLV